MRYSKRALFVGPSLALWVLLFSPQTHGQSDTAQGYEACKELQGEERRDCKNDELVELIKRKSVARKKERKRPDPNDVEENELGGEDETGKKMTGFIRILTEEYRWVYESENLIELAGQTYSFTEIAKAVDFRRGLERATALVAVGMASCEGHNQRREEARALDRADQELVWLRQILDEHSDTHPALYKLNLGQFEDPACPEDATDLTATQRRIAIVGVVERDKGVDLQQALCDALSHPDAFKVDISFDGDHYSRCRLTSASGD